MIGAFTPQITGMALETKMKIAECSSRVDSALLEKTRTFQGRVWNHPSRVKRSTSLNAMLAALALFLSTVDRAPAEDCPNPLEPMPAVDELLPNGMVRRRALEITSTRIVYADYMRTRIVLDTLVDVGTGWMENKSDVRRRIRYHHQFPIRKRPLILSGTVTSAATRESDLSIHVGCHRLNPEWSFHVIDGEADRLSLRIETTLDPGERVIFWWTVDLEIVASGRLPADRDGDGDVDIDDLVVALGELGCEDSTIESAGLRELMESLGSG